MSFLNRSGPTYQELARETYIKKNITVTLGLALKTLQQKHVNSEEPIYSEDTANTVCNILEAIFLHGLKASFTQKLSSYLVGNDASKGPQPSFWQLLTRLSHKDMLSQLNHLGQITTEIGMCRAWVRVALNDGIIESYLHSMMADTQTIRYFYHRTAYLRDEEQAGILNSYIQGISHFKFQLSYNSSVLNLWTMTPLVLAGLMEQMPTPRATMPTSPSDPATEDTVICGNQPGCQPGQVSEPIVAIGARRCKLPTPMHFNNTPLDNSMLTRTDIEEIRKLTDQARNTGTASTPTSQISFPDYAVDMGFLKPPHEESPALQSNLDFSRFPGRDSTPLNESSVSRPPLKGFPENIGPECIILEENKNEDSFISSSLNIIGQESISAGASSDIKLTYDTEPGRSTPPKGFSMLDVLECQLPLAIGKTLPLQPVMSEATARVDMAREGIPFMVISPNVEQHDIQTEDEDFYDKFPPSPKSNALGMMEGWSSEFHEPGPNYEDHSQQIPSEVSIQSEDNLATSTQVESYNTLMMEYPAGPVEVPTMSTLLDQLPQPPSTCNRASSGQDFKSPPWDDSSDDHQEEYEILPLGFSVTSSQADFRTQQLVGIIGKLCNERGLDQQNYQCNSCSRPVGMIYGKARVCMYDGCYYCYECHENEEAIIPSRIVHNWDFNKYKVACHTARFLKEAEEEPFLNIQHINPRLYHHVHCISNILELRVQLRYLKAYLFTCKQVVADELRKQVWPREYLYDDVHLYSILDLYQVQSGQLAGLLHRVIKFGSKHVYDCRLCSQKGFICEMCNSPKVIYPFQVDTTCRCEQCNAVYHRECKPSFNQCPKCERCRQRQKSTGHHDDIDVFSYTPEM